MFTFIVLLLLQRFHTRGSKIAASGKLRWCLAVLLLAVGVVGRRQPRHEPVRLRDVPVPQELERLVRGDVERRGPDGVGDARVRAAREQRGRRLWAENKAGIGIELSNERHMKRGRKAYETKTRR